MTKTMKRRKCSTCKKNPAEIYVTKIQNGESVKIGICLKCAKESNIKPLEDAISRMGLTDRNNDTENTSKREASKEKPAHKSEEPEADVTESEPAEQLTPSPKPQTTNQPTSIPKPRRYKYLERFCKSITQKAIDGKIDCVIGREVETERVIQILNRRHKNNPCLIGEPGVGKTAIAEGLAQRILNAKVPENMLGKEVHSLDMTALAAGAVYIGMYEERLKGVIKDVQNHGGVILFIDEIHMLIGAGTHGRNSTDAADMLKPALARGELQVVGATTTKEYRTFIESDAALERRLQPVKVDEPTIKETIEIVKGIKGYYEAFHKVKITDEMAAEAVKLADKYVNDRFFPDKAIDLIDEACSNLNIKRSAKRKRVPKLTKDNLARVIELWTKIPATSVSEDERVRLNEIETRMKEKVIGQDSAIESVCAAIKRKRLGISPKRKPASFLFIGSTGIGKTEVVKQLAKNLFDSSDAIIRLDMSEYGEWISKSKIIGTSPGYVGYEEGGQLTEKVLSNPYSIILLDEIEKAHPAVMDIFLQVLDEGHLTDGQGRTVDFKNTVIIMTSNAGSVDKVVGFNKDANKATKEKSDAALKKFLRPEFINRVDAVVHFDHLTKDNIKAIARLMLDELAVSMAELPVTLKYDETVLDYLAEKTDYETYGARNLHHVIQNEIEDKISAEILADNATTVTAIDLSVLDSVLALQAARK